MLGALATVVVVYAAVAVLLVGIAITVISIPIPASIPVHATTIAAILALIFMRLPFIGRVDCALFSPEYARPTCFTVYMR
jgi:hypothetical protein